MDAKRVAGLLEQIQAAEHELGALQAAVQRAQAALGKKNPKSSR